VARAFIIALALIIIIALALILQSTLRIASKVLPTEGITCFAVVGT
jgi:hypothetical protein